MESWKLFLLNRHVLKLPLYSSIWSITQALCVIASFAKSFMFEDAFVQAYVIVNS
jgi:hypothetical protein